MANTTEPLDRSARLALGQLRGVSIAQFDGQKFSIPAFSEVTLWDGPVNNYVFTDYTTDRITHISSSNVGDIGQIQILGLDENWDQVIQTTTLDGQNKVALTTELIRINGAIALKDLIGNVYIYEDGIVTGGIPNNLNTVKGFISYENNKTKASIYSIPRGYVLNFKKASYFTIPVTTGCCFQFKNRLTFFGGSTITILGAPLSSGGTTAIEISPVTSFPIPEKSDLHGRVYASLPNSAASAISDNELIKI